MQLCIVKILTDMIDIKKLTNLITSFRGTTQRNSITPETVGALFQAIADTLNSIDTSASANLSEYAKKADIGAFITNITVTEFNEDSINIGIGKTNVADGTNTFDELGLSLPGASRWHAGLMTAAHVNLLEQLKSLHLALTDKEPLTADWYDLSYETETGEVTYDEEGREMTTVKVIDTCREVANEIASFAEYRETKQEESNEQKDTL